MVNAGKSFMAAKWLMSELTSLDVNNYKKVRVSTWGSWPFSSTNCWEMIRNQWFWPVTWVLAGTAWNSRIWGRTSHVLLVSVTKFGAALQRCTEVLDPSGNGGQVDRWNQKWITMVKSEKENKIVDWCWSSIDNNLMRWIIVLDPCNGDAHKGERMPKQRDGMRKCIATVIPFYSNGTLQNI